MSNVVNDMTIPVFVINLDRRPERLANSRQNLQALGLGFERVTAFDGKAMDVRGFFRPWPSWAYAGFSSTSAGTIGCFLSHRSVWQRIVDEKIEYALILEDDCIFEQWLPEITTINPSELGLDVLRIGAHPDRKKEGLVNQMTKMPVRLSSQKLLGGTLSFDQTAGTYAYILTYTGAKKMIAYQKYWFPIDHFNIWRQYYGVRSAVLLPALIAPIEDQSDTRDNERLRKTKFQILIKRIMQRVMALNRTTTN